MTNHAAAIAWEFRQRHRWGWLGVGAFLGALVVVRLVVMLKGFPIDFDSRETFALMMVVPLTVNFTYFLAVFTFGLDGDLAARQSMFPARMFTKPVTTAALAWWPMLCGAVASVLLWSLGRAIAPWPPSIRIPLIWPGILVVVHLAWSQALTWMPYGLPGLRVVVVMGWLIVIDTVVLLALHFKASEPMMAAILLPLIPVAFPVARYAVARARSGDVPDWRFTIPRLSPLSGGKQFASSSSAQTWFEWRRNGWSLPMWVGILLPFELLLLWVAGPSTTLVLVILLGVCFTPVVVATFGALTVSQAGGTGGTSYSLSPFIAARPLTNGQIIAAKLRMTVWSTALAWVLVIVAIPIALQWSGEMPFVTEQARRFVDVVGAPRAIVFTLLVIAAFIVSTWKQLVQSLYLGLTGRERLIKGSVFAIFALLFCLGPILEWIVETKRIGAVWNALPLVFSGLVAAKMSAAVWIVVRLYRAGLVKDRTLVIAAGAWCAAVFSLYGVLAWILSTPHVPHYLLLLLAILAMPLARLSAAPLALAWDRHR